MLPSEVQHEPDVQAPSVAVSRPSLAPRAHSHDASGPEALTLRDLSGDLLRSAAWWLQPRDRLNLALTCKQLLRDTWGSFAEDELMARYPFESRLSFNLAVTVPQNSVTRDDLFLEQCSVQDHLRIVPERTRVQHCYVAVSECGRIVPVLAYDNVLRIFNARTGRLVAERYVGNVCGVTVWNSQRGRLVLPSNATSQRRTYEKLHGLDIEVGFGFSIDSRVLYLSSKDQASLYTIGPGGHIEGETVFVLANAEALFTEAPLVGGSCALSPDNELLAWVVFAGEPVNAYVTIWDVATAKCLAVSKLISVSPRQRNSLAWARVQFCPTGRSIIGIVNTAKKESRTVRRGEEFHNVHLSRFQFSLSDIEVVPSDASSHKDHSAQITARISTTETMVDWLEVEAERYPASIIGAMVRLLRGRTTKPVRRKDSELGSVSDRSDVGFHFNSLHSCPSESLYNTLVFGNGRGWRNNWFIAKHPIYGMHVNADASRALVCLMPSKNVVQRTVKIPAGGDVQLLRVGGEEDADASGPGGVPNRAFAFKGMPHRRGYASTSAFSSNGRWLAGVTLNDDRCVVCIRNVTHKEGTGVRPNA